MKSFFLRNFLTLFLFTIGGMATLSAQANGNEYEFYICDFGISPVPCEEDEEIEVCGCQICGEQIDCDDRDEHKRMHDQKNEDEKRKDEDREDFWNGNKGGDPWGSGIDLPEVIVRPEYPNNDPDLPEIPKNPNDPENPENPEEEENEEENEKEDSDKNPCMTKIDSLFVSMPLPIMKPQPPNEWNLNGFNYGNTRTNEHGSPRFHNGIDFAASVGAPVYAIYDGVVTRIVDEQVNRIKKGKKYVYPNGYTGDKDGAGNRIYVETIVNGDTIRMGYWHLQENTATTKPVADSIEVGTIVKAGDIIGYVGQTGNAMGGEPHLHVATYKIVNGKETSVNPKEYLGIEFEKDANGNTTIKTPCD